MFRFFVILCIYLIPTIGFAAEQQSPAEQAWAVLQQGMSDQNDERRAKAVHALGLLVKNKRAQQQAEAALVDQNPEVRAAAATALGLIGLPSSVPKLKEALKDSEAEVVFSAANALFVMRDPTAY